MKLNIIRWQIFIIIGVLMISSLFLFNVINGQTSLSVLNDKKIDITGASIFDFLFGDKEEDLWELETIKSRLKNEYGITIIYEMELTENQEYKLLSLFLEKYDTFPKELTISRWGIKEIRLIEGGTAYFFDPRIIEDKINNIRKECIKDGKINVERLEYTICPNTVETLEEFGDWANNYREKYNFPPYVELNPELIFNPILDEEYNVIWYSNLQNSPEKYISFVIDHELVHFLNMNIQEINTLGTKLYEINIDHDLYKLAKGYGHIGWNNLLDKNLDVFVTPYSIQHSNEELAETIAYYKNQKVEFQRRANPVENPILFEKYKIAEEYENILLRKNY
jgi:hypothetical protein